MKLLAAIALVLIGGAAGWFLRDSQDQSAQVRSGRTAQMRETPAPEATPPAQKPAGDAAVKTPSAPDVTKPDEKADEIDPEMKQFATLMKSMLPLIKISGKRDAVNKAAELAELLGLDEFRQKQLAEALEKDSVRKIEEGLLPMLEGKEPDEAMLANLQEKDGMTKALQDDMALILNNSEMEQVRTHYREQEAKQVAESIEHEIVSLGIPDLSKDQEDQLRALLRAEHEVDQNDSPQTVADVKRKMQGSGVGSSKESMLAALDESYNKRRAELSVFLTPVQLAYMDKQHAEERKEREAMAGAMGGMFGGFMTARKPKVQVTVKPTSEQK